MIILIFVAAVGSLMVSYAKARAEGLGLECKTGLLARPERVVILAIGLLTGTTIWALMLLAILSHVTAIERIVHVWRATNQPAANTHVEQLAADGLAQPTDSDELDHRLSIGSSELNDPLVSSVPTSLPPLTGSVPQD
jgi:CDP-diacylglycerol--glycerol-3-phosphate 3-phosphatidyltransferase